MSRQETSRTRGTAAAGDASSRPALVLVSDAWRRDRLAAGEKDVRMPPGKRDATASQDLEVDVRLTSSPQWNNLGIALQEHGRYGEARTAFREARRLSPQDIDAVTNLACLEMECGRYQHAYDMFLVVLGRSPQSVDAKIHAARACFELGKRKRAKSLIEDWQCWILKDDMVAELAALLIQIGMVRKGLSVMNEKLDFSRIGVRALAFLASALAHANRVKKARYCLGLLPPPEDIRNPALREEVLTVSARLAFLAGNHFSARKFLEFLLAPPPPGICRGAKQYFLLAEICYRQFDMEAAKCALINGYCNKMKASDVASPWMVEFSPK